MFYLIGKNFRVRIINSHNTSNCTPKSPWPRFSREAPASQDVAILLTHSLSVTTLHVHHDISTDCMVMQMSWDTLKITNMNIELNRITIHMQMLHYNSSSELVLTYNNCSRVLIHPLPLTQSAVLKVNYGPVYVESEYCQCFTHFFTKNTNSIKCLDTRLPQRLPGPPCLLAQLGQQWTGYLSYMYM